MFDYVYHDHLSYFSGRDFLYIATELDLVITYCKELPLKGGSIHIELQKAKQGRNQSKLFSALLSREEWLDHPSDTLWASAGERIRISRDRLGGTLSESVFRGRPIWGYGASHSTTTLTYALGIGNRITKIVDDGPTKQGLYAPGTGVKVVSIEELIASKNNATVLILAWQHASKIIERLKLLEFSGSLIVPFPVYRIMVMHRGVIE
jgi:hypothetical protein